MSQVRSIYCIKSWLLYKLRRQNQKPRKQLSRQNAGSDLNQRQNDANNDRQPRLQKSKSGSQFKLRWHHGSKSAAKAASTVSDQDFNAIDGPWIYPINAIAS